MLIVEIPFSEKLIKSIHNYVIILDSQINKMKKIKIVDFEKNNLILQNCSMIRRVYWTKV